MPDDNTALNEIRLRALARACGIDASLEFDRVVGAGQAGPGGPAVYLAGDGRALGPALRWAASRGAPRLELLALAAAGDLARRAALLASGPGPIVTVWRVEGAEVSPARPAPVATPPVLPAAHWALAGVMTEAGARPVDDHGLLVAEVAGLEVGRVVEGDHGPTIDVGVGQADRELSQLIHHDDDPGQGLRRVIGAVAAHRRSGSHHPLTRLARQRWLRSVVVDDPSLVGAERLDPLVPLRPRRHLDPRQPSAAAGHRADGTPLVVVAAAGIDLDLVPEAADYRQRWNPEAELLLVMPERDVTLSSGLVDRVPRCRAEAVAEPWAAPGGPRR
ncbi:MAG: hypothetical protein ACFCVK_05835 [Acidimicrobiales bacterium]